MLIKDFERFKSSLDKVNHYVYALCEVRGGRRIPFYIGKGVKGRCLQHFKEQTMTYKGCMISRLLEEESLGIDILRHGIKDDKTAKLVEATCIDLLGVGELSNKVRGSGTEMGRVTIEELDNLYSAEEIKIDPEDKGLAFLLNTTYKSGMSELELFEVTRGVWRNVPKEAGLKYAYATHGGLVKEVYQIEFWVRAGTQQYFTRKISENSVSNRWEFVGKKAPEKIRGKYIGKVIKKGRSFGSPFVKVGDE